jgi:hypothetical protein
MQAVPVFEIVPRWTLPTDVPSFLAWLREALPDLPDDPGRLRLFAGFPAAQQMPEPLRLALQALTPPGLMD